MVILTNLSGRFTKVAERLRLKPYRCPAGKLTIGYGRNIEDMGISESEAEMLFDNDWQKVEAELDANYPFIAKFSTVWYSIACDMLYNLGETKFAKMKKMLAAIANHDRSEALLEMVDSAWFGQVGNRSKILFIAGWSLTEPYEVYYECNQQSGIINSKFKVAFNQWLNWRDDQKPRYIARQRIAKLAKKLDLI